MRSPPADCSTTHRRPQRLSLPAAGIWEELSRGENLPRRTITRVTGPDLYRRSMYTFWKRTVPPAALNTFDAPDREKCTSRRLVTNTPLQALVLLNDPTYVEAARVLAERALLEAGSDAAARVSFLFRLATARRATPAELRVLLDLEQRELAHYKKDPAQAAKLIAVGASKPGTWKPSNWPPGPPWPAPSSTSTRPSPRNSCMDITRRHFFSRGSTGIGIAALGSLLSQDGFAAAEPARPAACRAAPFRAQSQARHLPASVRRSLADRSVRPQAVARQTHRHRTAGTVRMGQRITGMTSGQSALPVARSIFNFQPHGQSGAWVSELLPHTAKIVDDITIIKTVNTDAINHDPAITFIQTGSQQPGRPSMGAWVSYGLGSENRNLPGLRRDDLAGERAESRPAAVLAPVGQRLSALQAPGRAFPRGQRSGALSLQSRDRPRHAPRMLDAVAKLNRLQVEKYGDPEIETRISQYEMAYRMQTSVPDLMDLSKEPQTTFELYGPDARKPGTYAANCLLARRLAERDVRFVQLYHRGWDQHNDLPRDLALQCKGTDQASAALVTDLKQRGMLDDTLVIWGGEFGRTVYCQGKLTDNNYGRDHHPRCFTMWMAGGGVKRGLS